MDQTRTLAEIENEYQLMTNAIIGRIRCLVSQQPDKTISLTGDEVDEPTYVLFGSEADEFQDYLVESVFIHKDGDLGLVIFNASYGTTRVYQSEEHYLFTSLKWLVNICHNIYQVLGLDYEVEQI